MILNCLHDAAHFQWNQCCFGPTGMIVENERPDDLEILDDLRNNVSKFAVGLVKRKRTKECPETF